MMTGKDGLVLIHQEGGVPDAISVSGLTGATLADTAGMPEASVTFIQDAGIDGDGARFMVRVPDQDVRGGAAVLHVSVRRQPRPGLSAVWVLGFTLPDQTDDGPPRMEPAGNFTWWLKPGGER